MNQPQRARLTVDPEYPPRGAPMSVLTWEEQIKRSPSVEDAQVQMLYVVAVQTYKLRVTIHWVIGVAAAMFLLGVLVWVLALARG